MAHSTGLTPRQREVLQLIAEGHPFIEVADILVISLRTVNAHSYQLRQRLEARTLAHAVYLAMIADQSSTKDTNCLQ